ncbi:hypothetical protein AOQ84DRAFT_297746 [Glonium stellatum]|uniref:Phytocyanin domain-containing protein n=1 Tax=Glonium stellatum TaxID=574774 RepID=A0A8E2EWM6_9PEZI|nr:hypothetical protein AOQ84DRAFT_297746 [Glonium stellatum]
MSATAAAAMAATSVSAASAGMETVHVVQVGSNGTLTFSPNNVIAAVGDLVQFQFNPKNHSVVQSTFANPCIPIQNIMPNKTDAFFSGFMPTNRTVTDTTNILTFTVRVMDTSPIWFYCSQAMHCQAGMVGAINAAASGNKTVSAFAALAKVATQNLSPGESSSGSVSGGASASSAAAGATSFATSAAGAAASAGATGAAGTTSSSSTPAEQTTNAAPGRLLDATKNGFLGVAYAALAAFLVL